MRELREILRLKWVAQRSHREVARRVGVNLGAVASVVSRARLMGADLVRRPGPDLPGMHREWRRPGVTLELLHVEYLAAHPTGYRYSAFRARYRLSRARLRPSMWRVHRAGEKAFVDEELAVAVHAAAILGRASPSPGEARGYLADGSADSIPRAPFTAILPSR